MSQDYWFVTYLGYEQKQKSKRNLIVSFRNNNPKGNMLTDIHTSYPVLIPSFNIYSINQLENILKELKPINQIEKITVYLPNKFKYPLSIEDYTNSLKQEYNVDIENNNNKYTNFFTINLTLPNDPNIIDLIPSTKVNGFQIGNYLRITRRPLNILNRKVTLDNKLEEAFKKKNEIRAAETEILYLIDKIPEESKSHLVHKQLFEFFSNYQGSFKDDDIRTFIKTKKYSRLHDYFHNNNPRPILDLEELVVNDAKQINNLITQLDENNSLIPDKDKLTYNILLNYSKDNRALNVLGVKGITFHEHLFDELRKKSVAYFDIEKPLWKKEHEKILIDRRDKLLKLKSSPKYNSEEKQKRINKIILELEEKLTIDINGRIIHLYKEEYDAKINNITLLVVNEDGSLTKQYHKINYNPGIELDLFGYEVFNHKDERNLLNEFFYQLRRASPFFLSNHNIPYDIIQSRDAFINHLLGERFDLATESLNPIRNTVRKIYQRVLSPGQEVLDTYRLMFNFFPYLKSKFGTSHKLEDSTRFIRNLRNIDQDFRKIVTHEELRNLLIEAMFGDKKSELDLDKYTVSDVEEPLRDISEYPLFMDTVLKIKKLMPHVSITEIMFSPTVMEELHKTIHFQRNHNERYFGYEEKIREDEKEIFNKRYDILKIKLLKENNIKILNSSNAENVIQTYMPIELWLKEPLINIFNGWESYLEELPSDPIKEIPSSNLEKIAILQYPKYFLKDPLIDYYFYMRERNIYYNCLNKLNVDIKDAKIFLSEIENETFKHDKGKLLFKYNNCLDHLRNTYRSIYEKLPNNIRTSIRYKPSHLYLSKDNIQLDFGFDLFKQDNLDLIMLLNLSSGVINLLDKDTKILFKRFYSTFNTFSGASKDLESLIDRSHFFNTDKNNVIYLLNQRRRASARIKKFRLFYNYDPEDFDKIFSTAFSDLAKELKENNIQVIDLKGDYMFVKGNLQKNSMLIPIRNIPIYSKYQKKLEEDTESNLFEMQ
mgnify:FL=1